MSPVTVVAQPQARPVVSRKAAQPAQIALAGAAAAILLATPANAGVVFENKPQVKSFVAESTATTPSSKAPAAPSVKAEKKAEKKAERKEEESSDSFDPRSIALPASIIGVAALGFAASKVDSQFDEFISDAMYKKSDVLGAGYEGALKADGFAAKKAGTQPKKAGTQKGSGKGGKLF